MITLIGQMAMCLLVAAGIGVAVGWLLRHREASSHEQRLADLETEMHTKGQALDTAIYELKLKSSAVMTLESKIASLESLEWIGGFILGRGSRQLLRQHRGGKGQR